MRVHRILGPGFLEAVYQTAPSTGFRYGHKSIALLNLKLRTGLSSYSGATVDENAPLTPQTWGEPRSPGIGGRGAFSGQRRGGGRDRHPGSRRFRPFDKRLNQSPPRAGVTGVEVSLTDGDGNALESGQAVETPANTGRWVYTATAAVATGTTVRIAVTATDRPGGVGAAEGEKAL